MTTLNISLPDGMRSFIEERVAGGDYSTASEYMRELIREDQKRKARERLEALLLEGLESGKSKLTKRDWEDIRRRGMQRLKAGKQ